MRPLFAVAVERYTRTTKGVRVKTDIVYIHADDANHAKLQFMTAEPDRTKVKVVAVGPAVLFYVDDKDGKELSV